MPKSKEYVSTSDSDSDDEPKQKKSKHAKVDKKKESKPAKAKASGSSGDSNMFQLAKMRYVTVSEFRGKKYVNIREYYDADGELKPGKKGIALNEEQWDRLKELTQEVDDALHDL